MALIPSFIPGGDAINNAVSKFLDGGGTGIESIRRVSFSPTFLWTLDFIETNGIKPPSPFQDFFPASDVTFNLGIVNSHTVEQGQTSIAFPRNSNFKTVDITFYDDENRGLQKWISDWIEVDILNYGEFMSGINDAHTVVAADSFGNASRQVLPKRHIRIALLDRYRNEVLTYNYNIVPDGGMDFAGSQASEATQFAMKFNIVEQLGRPKKGNNQDFNFVRNILGRFI